MAQPTELNKAEFTYDMKTQDTDDELKATFSTTGMVIEDLDEAGIFLREHNYTQAYLQELLEDPQLNKRIVRRVDLNLMPLLCGTYLLQFIDKQALSYSAVFDLFPTTGITSSEYSWLASIFYFAYLFAEWPASYLVQHFQMAKVISLFVFCWGSTMLITVSCHNFTGMAICRFILGCFESVITPAFMMIVSMWYVKKEQPFRAGMFYCFNGVGSMVGGILFFATGYAKGFAVWRTIYCLCGGLTVLWSIVLYFFLPNNIMSAKRFTPEDKALLIARSQRNRTGVYNRKIKWGQIIEALTDVQVWLLFFFTLFNEVINGGIANFGKLIVKEVAGGNALRTTAYGIPQGAFQVLWILSATFLASKLKNCRTYIMAAYLTPTTVGVALLWKIPRTNTEASLMAYYICASFVASLVLALQLPASNVGGYTKRTTATAFVFLAYCAGNVIGPHAFLGSEAPLYQTGCKVIISCSVAQVVIAFMLRALLIHRNKKRDREALSSADLDTVEASDRDVLDDVTDFENPKFRYVY